MTYWRVDEGFDGNAYIYEINEDRTRLTDIYTHPGKIQGIGTHEEKGHVPFELEELFDKEEIKLIDPLHEANNYLYGDSFNIFVPVG